MRMDGYRLKMSFKEWRGLSAELAGLDTRLTALMQWRLTNTMRKAWTSWCYVLDWQAWMDDCNTRALQYWMNRTGVKQPHGPITCKSFDVEARRAVPSFGAFSRNRPKCAVALAEVCFGPIAIRGNRQPLFAKAAADVGRNGFLCLGGCHHGEHQRHLLSFLVPGPSLTRTRHLQAIRKLRVATETFVYGCQLKAWNSW